MLHRSIRSDPANYGAWFALCIHLRSELVNLAAHPYLLGDGAVQGILDRIKETLSSKCNRIQHILTFLIHNLPRKVEQAEHLMEKSEAQDASSLLVWCRILDADCNVFLAQIQDAADVNSRINYIKAAYSACEEILNSSSGDSGVTSTAFSVMARALRCSGDVTLALECYKKAADQSPSSLIVWEVIVNSYILYSPESKLSILIGVVRLLHGEWRPCCGRVVLETSCILHYLFL